jgi:hypothetical protein
MIQFSQGDTATLQLTIQDGDGNPIDITGATFSTEIKGNNTAGAITFPNAQHTIIDPTTGRVNLALTAVNTAACGVGEGKDVITTVTISGTVIRYRGIGILNVYAPDPAQ